MKKQPEKEKRPLASKALNSTKLKELSSRGNGVSRKVLVSWVKDATSTVTRRYCGALSVIEAIRTEQ